MVEIKNIIDRESLREWLASKPEKFSQIITHRSAMRALPDFWYWTLTSTRAQEEKVSALPILRASLIAEVISYSDEINIKPDLEKCVSDAAQLANASGEIAKSHTDIFSYEDILSLKDVFFVDEGKAAATAFAANSALVAEPMMVSFAADSNLVYNGFWNLIRADVSDFHVGGVSIRKELWQRELNPFSERWTKIKRLCDDGSADWSFWIKWYEAVLLGEPFDAEMLEEIALIFPHHWEQSPAHINELIAKIEKEFELKAKIAELEGKLLQISSSGRGIGDNQGPPMADEPVAKEIMIIWEPLQELKQEIEEKHPNRERLLKIAKKIGELAALILKWTAQKIDLAANTAVKVGTSAAVGLLVIRLTTEAKPVASMLTTISDLAVKLAGYLS
ncbi:MAG: hypothetical protein L3J33_11265 [Rhodobacteraceae bacterium]|nr:hypothetical protein [Paracoccaceae bacterium]